MQRRCSGRGASRTGELAVPSLGSAGKKVAEIEISTLAMLAHAWSLHALASIVVTQLPVLAPQPLQRASAPIAAADSGAPPKRRAVKYMPEEKLEEAAREAALAQGIPESRALALAACCRNIYGIGCAYPAETLSRVEDLCRKPAAEGEGWAVLMQQCLRGRLPRLRCEQTALARMAAARRGGKRK